MLGEEIRLWPHSYGLEGAELSEGTRLRYNGYLIGSGWRCWLRAAATHLHSSSSTAPGVQPASVASVAAPTGVCTSRRCSARCYTAGVWEGAGFSLLSPPQSGKRCRPAGEAGGLCCQVCHAAENGRMHFFFPLSVIAGMRKAGCGSDIQEMRNVCVPPCLVSGQGVQATVREAGKTGAACNACKPCVGQAWAAAGSWGLTSWMYEKGCSVLLKAACGENCHYVQVLGTYSFEMGSFYKRSFSFPLDI